MKNVRRITRRANIKFFIPFLSWSPTLNPPTPNVSIYINFSSLVKRGDNIIVIACTFFLDRRNGIQIIYIRINNYWFCNGISSDLLILLNVSFFPFFFFTETEIEDIYHSFIDEWINIFLLVDFLVGVCLVYKSRVIVEGTFPWYALFEITKTLSVKLYTLSLHCESKQIIFSGVEEQYQIYILRNFHYHFRDSREYRTSTLHVTNVFTETVSSKIFKNSTSINFILSKELTIFSRKSAISNLPLFSKIDKKKKKKIEESSRWSRKEIIHRISHPSESPYLPSNIEQSWHVERVHTFAYVSNLSKWGWRGTPRETIRKNTIVRVGRERERRRIWTRKIRDFFPSHFAMKRSMLYYLGARLEGCHVHTSRISTLFRLTNGGVAGHDFLLAPLFRFATTACCASAHVASFRERLNKT